MNHPWFLTIRNIFLLLALTAGIYYAIFQSFSTLLQLRSPQSKSVNVCPVTCSCHTSPQL